MTGLKNLPKTITVRIEDGGTGPNYMVAAETLLDHAEIGEKRRVGVYTLTELRDVEGVASSEIVKQRRKAK